MSATISFDSYSRKYDMLLTYSPPYQEIGKRIVSALQEQYDREDRFTVLDIGGGTGNFSKKVQDAFPNVVIHLLEPNAHMSAIAQQKLDNISFLNTPFEQFESTQQFDVILCVHALYLMPSSNISNQVIKQWCKRLILKTKKSYSQDMSNQ